MLLVDMDDRLVECWDFTGMAECWASWYTCNFSKTNESIVITFQLSILTKVAVAYWQARLPVASIDMHSFTNGSGFEKQSTSQVAWAVALGINWISKWRWKSMYKTIIETINYVWGGKGNLIKDIHMSWPRTSTCFCTSRHEKLLIEAE